MLCLMAKAGVDGGQGGSIFFGGESTGGTAQVKIFGNGVLAISGYLDISEHNASGVTIGSLGGDGFVFLGANNLAVGTNRRSTIFSGTIQDGGGNGLA